MTDSYLQNSNRFSTVQCHTNSLSTDQSQQTDPYLGIAQLYQSSVHRLFTVIEVDPVLAVVRTLHYIHAKLSVPDTVCIRQVHNQQVCIYDKPRQFHNTKYIGDRVLRETDKYIINKCVSMINQDNFTTKNSSVIEWLVIEWLVIEWLRIEWLVIKLLVTEWLVIE